MSYRKAAMVAVAALFFTAGCGKKGPLIYPDLLVSQPPGQVVVEQSGADLRLSFILPDKDRAGRHLSDLDAVRISRRACKNPECKGCLEPFHEIARISGADHGKQVIWSDSDVNSGEIFQYRLESIQRKKTTDLSFYDTKPVKVTDPMTAPKVAVSELFGGIIRVNIAAPPPTGVKPAGYLIYRAAANTPLLPLARLDSTTDSYQDQAVQPAVLYRYAARSIATSEDGMVIESLMSETVSLSLSDNLK